MATRYSTAVLVVLTVNLLNAAPVLSGDGPVASLADREKCAAIGAQVANSVDGISEIGTARLLIGGKITISKPLVAPAFYMGVGCGVVTYNAKDVAVRLGWNGGLPPDEFWKVAGKAGSTITKESPETVTAAVKQCVNDALAHPREEASGVRPQAEHHGEIQTH